METHSIIANMHCCLHLTVQEMTGITEALIQDERPLSVVFPEFLEWINTITEEVSRASNITYVPGIPLLPNYIHAHIRDAFAFHHAIPSQCL